MELKIVSLWVQKSNQTTCVWKIWNPSTYACEIDRYLKSIIDDSIVTYE